MRATLSAPPDLINFMRKFRSSSTLNILFLLKHLYFFHLNILPSIVLQMVFLHFSGSCSASLTPPKQMSDVLLPEY